MPRLPLAPGESQKSSSEPGTRPLGGRRENLRSPKRDRLTDDTAAIQKVIDEAYARKSSNAFLSCGIYVVSKVVPERHQPDWLRNEPAAARIRDNYPTENRNRLRPQLFVTNLSASIIHWSVTLLSG